jgi:hypothetical protein
MKNLKADIDAIFSDLYQPQRTKLLKTQPKIYPQKLRIISETEAFHYLGTN